MKTCGYHTSQRTLKYFNDQGESTLQRGQDCCHIVLFFSDTMFEFQLCHYYERFSQCFYILW
jgi:hypothetical protein